MTGLFFSIKDLAVLMSAFVAVLFGWFFIQSNAGNTAANKLLGSFLLVQSVTSVISVLIYGSGTTSFNTDTIIMIMLVESAVMVLEGFLLYWYTKILLFNDFTWGRRIYLHIALTASVIAANAYNLYATDEWQVSPESTLINYGVFFRYVTSALAQLTRCVYGVLCFVNIYRYRQRLEDEYSNTDKVDLSWLKLLIVGYLLPRAGWALIPLWFAIAYLSGYGAQAADSIVASYSFVFDIVWLATLSALLYFGFQYSPRFQGLREDKGFSSNGKHRVKPEHIRRVEQYMLTHKPYLSSALKLEDLAAKVALPPKTLSILLNTHHKKNFCEFINTYRIEEAKQLLSTPIPHRKTMLDIAVEVGFNSKSAFNRSFKDATGATPLHYRRETRHSGADNPGRPGTGEHRLDE